MKTLILAEKPSVASDIAKALGGFQRSAAGDWERADTIISNAIGHLAGIAAPEAIARQTPVIPEAFEVVALKKTEKHLKHVAKLMQRADVSLLINACDAGREGELIFRLIVDYAKSAKPIKRMWLQSMTPNAIREAHRAPRSEREMASLAAAARARAEADWLVGINGSRFCKRVTGETTPVGRVQTPTLMIVVEREEAIRAFVERVYHEVHLQVGIAAGEFKAIWHAPERAPAADGTPRERLWDRPVAEAIVRRCEGQPIRALTEETKPSRRAPPPLFDLTTLQREANRLFGFSAKKTLDLAQVLYERHKVLTYPRTDAKALPEDYVPTITRTIESLRDHGYGQQATPVLDRGWIRPVKRIFDNSKISDHFAIVPTGKPADGLSQDESRIYELVARRLLAAFYPDAEFSSTVRTALIGEDTFIASGHVLTTPGWLSVYQDNQGDAKDAPAALPPLRAGEPAKNLGVRVVDGKTRAPDRYTEATLLSAMEHAGRQVDEDAWRDAMAERGLGTPATRAATIEGLIADGYLTRSKKQLLPTERAFALKALLGRMEAQALLSPALTGEWEARLKSIELGNDTAPAFRTTIETFVRGLAARAAALPSTAGPVTPCPTCGKDMRRLKGPKGHFWGCSGYPDCTSTLPDVDGKPGPARGAAPPAPSSPAGATHKCPLCGSPMRLRNGTRGAFWGCSGYPKCTHTQPDAGGSPAAPRAADAASTSAAGQAGAATTPRAPGTTASAMPRIGESCPSCGTGSLVSKSLKGKPFIGCSGFPGCKYFRWANA
ncbi:topoisomerase DNA-binding C4 zinc finger domain-containing protein [Burkholderia gladioli]|uniref:DNA topoisomerase n=1 Tax=Burkholderia gladioli TaxID=28095 RepID=UPI001C21BDC5|nr:DNA topoisomerase [Burkholderia gladioli]MBU9198825.1 topoisomerase DNA-binding C4 zinc finger domain-containing protein [Burkholderia gladioli]